MIGPILRPVLRNWHAAVIRRAATLPAPTDNSVVRAEGDDPDLILLLGNGTAHGWGVATHQLALPGQLSRALRDQTGRPCSVQYIGANEMMMSTAVSYFPDDLKRFDVVVIVLGVSDAATLTPVNDWRRDLGRLLDALETVTKPTVQILTTGIQPIRSIITLDSPLGSLANHHAKALNAATEILVRSREDVDFYALDSARFEHRRPYGSPDVYRKRAEELTPAIVSLLARVRSLEGQSRIPRNVDG